MALRSALVPALLLCVAGAPMSSSQVLDKSLRIDSGCAFDKASTPRAVVLFTSDAEAENVIKRIVRASGLPQTFEVYAAGVDNAEAGIEPLPGGKGHKRVIIYSQTFMRAMRDRSRTEWAGISIMAHEVGHHLSGHTLLGTGSVPKIELEADYFSGFMVQKLGGGLGQAQVAMSLLANERGSSTHPGKADRLAAIANGWTAACEADVRCANSQPSNPPGEPQTSQRRPPSQPDGQRVPERPPAPRTKQVRFYLGAIDNTRVGTAVSPGSMQISIGHNGPTKYFSFLSNRRQNEETVEIEEGDEVIMRARMRMDFQRRRVDDRCEATLDIGPNVSDVSVEFSVGTFGTLSCKLVPDAFR